MTASDLLDEIFMSQGKQLESFLYDIAKYAYKPHGYNSGYGHLGFSNG